MSYFWWFLMRGTYLASVVENWDDAVCMHGGARGVPRRSLVLVQPLSS